MPEGAVARLAGIMSPLDWVQTATVAVQSAVPALSKGADGPLDYVQQVPKEELQVGSHIYTWRLGFTYSHHGIVVRTEPCGPDCAHDTLRCCSIVHFRPPEGERPGGIELASLADFARGRGVCACRYGVPSAEFYFRRSGSCCTQRPDALPLVVLRALSLIDVAGPEVAANTDEPAAQLEYDLLRKNSELLASWCKVGAASGVRRFRSQETAFSRQSAPGRFVRLGLAVAVPVGIAAVGLAASGAAAGGAAASAGAAAAGSSSGAAAASAIAGEAAAAAGAASAAAVGAGAASSSSSAAAGAGVAAATGVVAGSSASAGAASAAAGTATGVAKLMGSSAAAKFAAGSAAASAVGRRMVQAGTLAASSAAQSLVVDMARRPAQARELLSQVQSAVPRPSVGGGSGGAGASGSAAAPVVAAAAAATSASAAGATGGTSYERERQRLADQGAALVAAFRACMLDMGVAVPKPLGPLLDEPVSAGRWCEILVDALEAAEPGDLITCQAVVQSLLDDLAG